MEEKRQDLNSEKQKRLIQRLVNQLSQSHADFYYLSTTQLAAILEETIQNGTHLSVDEKTLLSRLSQRDIQLLLSLH